MRTRLARPCTATLALWLLAASVAIQPGSIPISASQIQPDSVTASATNGTVVLQPAGAGIGERLSSDSRPVAWGDLVQLDDDAEAALTYGKSLAVRLFHNSQARILGGNAPDEPSAGGEHPAIQPLPDGELAAYQLLRGVAYNTASSDLDVGLPVAVASPGANIVARNGSFLVYYDALESTTWVIVTDGTVKVTTAAGALDVPSAFLTSVVDGSAPSGLEAASRARVGNFLPSIDALTNGAFRDEDILAAAQPDAVDPRGAPDNPTAPASDAARGQSPGETGLLPPLLDLGLVKELLPGFWDFRSSGRLA